MTPEDAKRIERLPIWAAVMIRQLDADLIQAEKEIAIYASNGAPSNTTADPRVGKVSLGDGMMVRFTLEDRDVDVRVLPSGRTLTVRGGMHDQLFIEPTSHSSFRISASPYVRNHKQGDVR